MENTITHVAMETHKKQHRVDLVYPNKEQIIEFSVKNTPAEIRKIKINALGHLQDRPSFLLRRVLQGP